MSETSRLLQIVDQKVSFPKPLAMILKPTKAMLLAHLHFWIDRIKDEKREDCYNEGRYWWYHSIPQWHKDFPFLNTRTIERALSELEEAGLIQKAKNISKVTFSDRTNWYSTNGAAIDVVFKQGVALLKRNNADKMSVSVPTKCRDSTRQNVGIKKNKRRIETKTDEPRRGKASADSTDKAEVRRKHMKTYLDRFAKSATVESLGKLWELLVTQYYGRDQYLPLIGSKKDRTIAKTFIKYCAEADVNVPEFFEFVIQHWGTLKKKKSLKWADFGSSPSFSTVYALKDKFISEYRGRNGKGGIGKKEEKEIYTRAEDVPKDHPHRRSILRLIREDGKAVLS